MAPIDSSSSYKLKLRFVTAFDSPDFEFMAIHLRRRTIGHYHESGRRD